MNSVPRILNALLLVLRRQIQLEMLVKDDDMRERVRAHAGLRYAQRIPSEGVVTRDVRNGDGNQPCRTGAFGEPPTLDA